jgi:hypothetical protein
MQQTTLERVVALVEPETKIVPPEQINAEIARLTEQQRQLFGFEEGANDAIKKRLEELSRLARFPDMSTYRKFTTLSMLDWRGKNYYPKIVLFSLKNPVFKIKGGESDFYRDIDPELPKELAVHYKDVQDRFCAMCNRWTCNYSTFSISCRYDGVIPPATRQKTKQAVNVFGLDKVFIMAEATKWAEQSTPKPILDLDPLVVGWDGASLWLIDKFDLTPIEQMLAVEFTE